MVLNYGLKISKDGHDVSTATADDLFYTSKRNCLKFAEVASTTITTDAFAGDGTRTIAHGLSFIPVVVPLIKDTDGAWYMAPAQLTSGGGGAAQFGFTIDATNIVFAITDGDTSTTYNINYYVSETESAS